MLDDPANVEGNFVYRPPGIATYSVSVPLGAYGPSEHAGNASKLPQNKSEVVLGFHFNNPGVVVSHVEPGGE